MHDCVACVYAKGLWSTSWRDETNSWQVCWDLKKIELKLLLQGSAVMVI